MSKANIMTAQELVSMEKNPPALTCWLWNGKNRTLTNIKRGYEVDFEQMRTSAECLDWVFQIYAKTWADPKTISELLAAIRFYINPQSNLCSYGCECSCRTNRSK